ncbi:MAG: hypothetical protein IH851_10645 [Armatimonadetes bacterium]|nr:hypothetical protein [Armatimonadota bacterium]
MRRQLYWGLAIIALAGVGAQRPLPPLLTGHVKTLEDAASLRITFTVRAGLFAPEEYTLAYAKPNLFRIDGPKGFVLSDGKNVYVYSDESNTYTVSEAASEAVAEQIGAEEVWAWSAFFDKGVLKSFRTAEAGGKRNIRGNEVTEVSVTLGGERKGTASLYIDTKLKVARGFIITAGDKDLQVIASEIILSAEPISASEFAFTAPEGAKEAEETEEAKSGVSFAAVQALMSRSCMPCHSRRTRSGGYQYTTYQGIVMAVVPGDPQRSPIINAVSGPNPRMPQTGAPLTAGQVSLLSDWIAAGANRD